MRNLLIAMCCIALMGSVSVASAQTNGAAAQKSMKTHNLMNSNAKMKKKHTKSMKSDDTMKSDMSKDTTKERHQVTSFRSTRSRDTRSGIAASCRRGTFISSSLSGARQSVEYASVDRPEPRPRPHCCGSSGLRQVNARRGRPVNMTAWPSSSFAAFRPA